MKKELLLSTAKLEAFESVWSFDVFLENTNFREFSFNANGIGYCEPRTYKLYNTSNQETQISSIIILNSTIIIEINKFSIVFTSSLTIPSSYFLNLRFEFDYNPNLYIEVNNLSGTISEITTDTFDAAHDIVQMLNNHYNANQHTPLVVYSYFTPKN